MERPSPEVSQASQVEAAKALESCLIEMGIPATTMAEGGGVRVIWSPTSESEIVWSTPYIDSGVQPRPGGTPPSDADVEGFMEAHEGAFGLRVDGVDRSEDYGRCYRDSGYEPPSLYGTPDQEIAAKERRVEVSNRWAQCARDHGFPSVSDVDRPIADQGTTWPVAILPSTMTEAQVAALVEVCPVVAAGVSLSDADIIGELAKVPAIGFDTPFYNGRSFREPPTDEDYARYTALLEAVYKQLDDFFGEDGWTYGFGFSPAHVDWS
jgi:hypothetical protein